MSSDQSAGSSTWPRAESIFSTIWRKTTNRPGLCRRRGPLTTDSIYKVVSKLGMKAGVEFRLTSSDTSSVGASLKQIKTI